MMSRRTSVWRASEAHRKRWLRKSIITSTGDTDFRSERKTFINQTILQYASIFTLDNIMYLYGNHVSAPEIQLWQNALHTFTYSLVLKMSYLQCKSWHIFALRSVMFAFTHKDRLHSYGENLEQQQTTTFQRRSLLPLNCYIFCS